MLELAHSKEVISSLWKDYLFKPWHFFWGGLSHRTFKLEGISKGSPNQPTNQSSSQLWCLTRSWIPRRMEMEQPFLTTFSNVCLSLWWKVFPCVQFEPFTLQMPIVSSPLAMHNREDNLYGELLAFSKATSSPHWTSPVSASSSYGASQAPDYFVGSFAELYFIHCPSCMGGIQAGYGIPDAV